MIPDSILQEIKQAHPGYVAHWVYYEHGTPTMIVARYNKNSPSEKKEKFFDQWHFHANSWNHGILAGTLPLYGLNSLSHEHPFGAILITGGEKCAAALHQLGLAAVTNCLGESSVNKSDFSSLRNKFLFFRNIKFIRMEFAKFCHGIENIKMLSLFYKKYFELF